MKQGSIPFPLIIGIVLSVAFIAMLIVTIFTLISIRREELKTKRESHIPPSATRKNMDFPSDSGAANPWPVGEWANRYLIGKGYIRTNSVVRSFFKSLEFLEDSLGNDYKYKLPWYMIIGTEESGKSSLMSGFTHDEIYNDEKEGSSCTWWFLKNGVILDIKGTIFLPKVGFNADEKNWNTLLNMLSRYRSKKPLNGIILTIPANELYGRNKLSQEDIRRRSQYIARKLSFAQNYLGMKLPVYVVVTKTDLVPGFQSFCSEIPVRNRSNMLGWSSPYSIDVVYTSQIIDEGFVTFENELNKIRIEIFSENSTTAMRDGVFIFPSELLTIKTSLGIYIDSIFKSPSVEERFYFRGFYFTGDSKMMPLLPFNGDLKSSDTMAVIGTPDADINEAGSISASFGNEQLIAKKIFFFEDLLLRKIFVEDGIASPMRSKIHRITKSILIAKISTAAFVVIGSYGLFSASDQLKINKNILYPSLFKLSSLIKNAGDWSYTNLKNDGNEMLANCTNQLLLMMQQLNNMYLSSAFVPASWFSSINNDLKEALRASYQKVVVRTIYMNLLLKMRELLNMKPESKSDSIWKVLNPYNSDEYFQLKNYVFGLIDLEKNIKKFDSLRISGDPKDLEDLINYTFQEGLSNEFLENYQQFRLTLMNTPFPPINLSPYRQTAYGILLSLFQRYLDTIFTSESENSIFSILTRFVTQFSRQNLKETSDCTNIINFSQELSKACKELGEEGKVWLDKEVFETDEEYDSFLDGVELSFGKEIAQKLLDITAVNFGHLKARLEEFNNLLEMDISGQNSKIKKKNSNPSRGIYLMERCLSPLCSHPFMAPSEDYQLITDIPEGKMIFWDDELIRYAYNIGKNYEHFVATEIKNFPRSIQEGIGLLAKSNLCTVIASTVAKAQSLTDEPSGITPEIVSEEILQKQIAELKGVGNKFINLLRILRDDKLGFVFGDLRGVLNKVGFSLLTHIDKLLENQKPYYPKNLTFSYWNGNNGAGLFAFSAADTEELSLYLQQQRSLIFRLALDFAETVVNFLNSEMIYDGNYGNLSQLTKWTRIVDNAKGFVNKDPTNSITAVEKFIKGLLNSYNLDNITEKIDLKDIKGDSGDYFQNIIKETKRGIMARAEVLIRKRNVSRYNSLREYYIKHLENKYPFSDYDKTKRTATDADLTAIKEFFKMYDEFGGTPERILDQIYQLGGDAKIPYEFLKKMHDLRAFCGNFFDNQYESLKVSLEFNFDINKKAEKNTEYLVDRIFKPSNDFAIEPVSMDKSGIWYFGQPFEINLRWADGDAQADKPVYNPNDPDFILTGNMVKIQCTGDWSCLRFLQKYRVESVNADKMEKNQILLGFKIPLNGGKAAGIFAGVNIYAPKKPGESSNFSVKLPEIAGKMPELPDSVKEVLDEAVLVSNPIEDSSLTEDSFSRSVEIVDEPFEQNEKDKKENVQRESEKEKTKKEVLNILNSENSPQLQREESVIEISEEPIN
jgi:type VI secretion system protein ImpL